MLNMRLYAFSDSQFMFTQYPCMYALVKLGAIDKNNAVVTSPATTTFGSDQLRTAKLTPLTPLQRLV